LYMLKAVIRVVNTIGPKNIPKNPILTNRPTQTKIAVYKYVYGLFS